MRDTVRCSREKVQIHTHLTHPDEKNPIFFEKRNVQGASGSIFPMAMCDRMEAACHPITYNQLRLENKYIDVTMLPELGGRIYSALDKQNGYDFIFRNPTIKPAQIGLCGPWISGGIEFNWPQHHRPTTFKPVDHCMETHEDGSHTVWMGEIEPLNRTKGMVGVTVYPDKTYIQAKVRLFNRTPYPQTFMWWANLGVAANASYRAVFPGDIHWASDHAWASTSSFPVLSGLYKGIDMGAGTDVRNFPNMPIPASFFTYNSKYDFLSGYDFGRDAGIVHVADRHVSPGKKMFTWGVSGFSKAWFRNLSDGDGAYIELMTGIYTQNQPDFSWIMPYEYKTAEQYWYPIRGIGEVRNANLYGALGFERVGEQVSFALNVTESLPDCRIVITEDETVIYENHMSLSPETVYKETVACDGETPDHALKICIFSHDGEELISYRPEEPVETVIPAPLDPAPLPEEITDPNELFQHALHLWQYRHPYFEPMDYLERALGLDPHHIGCNNLAGKIMMERGNFEEALRLFSQAAEDSVRRNPNPYDTEPFYNRGILRKLLGRTEEAYEDLFRAVWVYAHKSAGYLAIAEIDCLRGAFRLALQHVETALEANGTNFKAWKLKAMILGRLGKPEQALHALEHILKMDPLDFVALYERVRICRTHDLPGRDEAESAFNTVFRPLPEHCLDIAMEYASAGFLQEAIDVLERYCDSGAPAHPVIGYYLSHYYRATGQDEKSEKAWQIAVSANLAGCFHSRLESFSVFAEAMRLHPADSHAPYLLGNMYYGRKSYHQGIDAFAESVRRGADFPTAYRNLALGLFDWRDQKSEAGVLIEKAFRMDETDARVFYEWMQYLRAVNTEVSIRLSLMEQYSHLAEQREDLYAKWVSTYVEAGQYVKAKTMLEHKEFHPYEGGEGIVNREYVNACHLEGMRQMELGNLEGAHQLFLDAASTPANFNMGIQPVVHPHAHIDYHLGLVQARMADTSGAEHHFRNALTDLGLQPEMKYYMGLSCLALGEKERADGLFRQLLADADALLANGGRFSYFTKSLVTMLPFEQNNQRNEEALACYLKGLAYRGMGEWAASTQAFEQALHLKVTQYMARILMKP